MKTKTSSQVFRFITVAILCLLAQAASSFPFTDPFNYPLGNLGGDTNSEFNIWAKCGATNTTPDIMVTNITLTYPGLACPGTNSVYFTGTNGSSGFTDRIPIAPLMETITTNASNVLTTNFSVYAFTNGTIYASFVFVLTNLGSSGLNGAAGTVFAGFNNLTGSQTSQPSTFCMEVCVREDQVLGPPDYQLGIAPNVANTADRFYATNDLLVGETNFIVASYTTNYDTNTYGVTNGYVQLWINPGSNTFGAASPLTVPDITNATPSSFGGSAGLESFLFRQGNQFVPSFVATDLRIGTNWSDVTPPAGSSAPAAVPLTVTLSGGNAVLSWPANATGFTLQGAPILTSSNAWTNVTASTNIVGTNFTVSDPIAGKNYYRLFYP